MAEQETQSSLSLTAKISIAVGIIVVAAPVLYVVAVMIALKAHVTEDCGLQFRRLGMGCRMYAEKHEGRMPSKWSDLSEIEDGPPWHKMLRCPTSGHEGGTEAQVDLWADYRLIPGRTTNDPLNTILAIELLSNHKSGANVLFVDGSSQWWPAKRVLGEKAILQSTNQ